MMRWMWLMLLAPAFAGCLADGDNGVGDEDPFAQKPALDFRPAVDLGSKAQPGAFGTACDDSVDDGDCGLGEPTIEVAGDGTIYLSGVCCLTVAPPVYVSRDGGENFQELETPGVREAFGIEGDFAIDQEGRVYFADIEFAGTFQVTVWDKDGEYVRHTKWPAPPLVDRDWIRAEGDGTAYYIYNTGTATRVYKTTDAAATWSPDAIHELPYGLGNTAIMPGKELCVFGGDDGGKRSVDCSTDGGDTWTQEPVTLPNGDDSYPVGAFDEAGILFLAETQDQSIQYVQQGPDGTWREEPVTISPAGTHRMPWIAAGAQGAMAAAWYGTPDEEVGADTEWFVYAAASRNASDPLPRWDHVIADPEPVFVGALGRDLLDFLQVELGPEGAIHIGYSKQRPGEGPDGNEEQLHYVRSEPSPLAMDGYSWGPD